MTSKQAYQETYRLYRVMASMTGKSHTERDERGALVKQINRQHAASPKVAAAAHTSFSMRALFNREV